MCRLLGVLDEGEVELEVDLLAHEHAAGGERRVPGETEVLAVERGGALEADAGVAPRVLDGAGELEVDADGLGDAADGAVAGDAVGLVESGSAGVGNEWVSR